MSLKERQDQRFISALTQHRAGMYRVALSMLRSAHDAEDAVSQATMKAYASLHTLKDWGKVRPWLTRITVNACHTTLRRRKRESPAAWRKPYNEKTGKPLPPYCFSVIK